MTSFTATIFFKSVNFSAEFKQGIMKVKISLCISKN